jgi:hypothetical protein
MVLSETVRGRADDGDALDGPHVGQPGRRRTLPSGVLWSLMRVRVTLGYAVVLITIGATLLAFGSPVQDLVVSHVSTNLHNLANGYLGTLISSAFVTEGRDIYAILPGLVCLLALAELIWCGRRLVLTFVLGHVGATVMVAAGLAVAITAGWLPITVAHANDVGISYGAAAVLGALTAVIPPRWRPGWISWWLAIALVAATWADFTGVGHMIALILGMGLSSRLGSVADWNRTRVALLIVGVAFGYMMITGSSSPVAVAVAGPAGLLVALIAQWVARRWRTARRHRSVPARPGQQAPAPVRASG